MSAQTGNSTESFHAVRFYDSSDSLCRIVAGFLYDGLKADQPALAIATPDHLVGIVGALRARGLDVDALKTAGDLLLLDAQEMLGTFMVDGMPDPDRFKIFGVQVIERACHGRRHCTIRAYGEMVDVLWKQGQSVAAIRLEMLWNTLAASKDFSLLCGYAMGNFYKGSQQHEICGHHSHLVNDEGRLEPTVPPTIN
jgi:hypothetical protein